MQTVRHSDHRRLLSQSNDFIRQSSKQHQAQHLNSRSVCVIFGTKLSQLAPPTYFQQAEPERRIFRT
jgi:hypothetical protein